MALTCAYENENQKFKKGKITCYLLFWQDVAYEAICITISYVMQFDSCNSMHIKFCSIAPRARARQTLASRFSNRISTNFIL